MRSSPWRSTAGTAPEAGREPQPRDRTQLNDAGSAGTLVGAVSEPSDLTISGVVSTGKGMSTRHMKRRDYSALGYEPVPGTLNVTTGKAGAQKVRRLPGGVEVTEDDNVGIFHPMSLDGIKVHVRAYRRGVEVVAPIRLREALKLQDGDPVTLRWRAKANQLRRSGLGKKARTTLKRAHRRNAQVLLQGATWSLRRGVDLYQGDQRDIEDRWQFIRPELVRLDARSVLDIGCAEGTFIQRAAKELGCFGLGVERTRWSVLSGEVGRLNAGHKGYAVINADLTPETIRRLPNCDVTLCLSVVHHVINKGGLDAGREFLAALASVTTKAIVFEMGAPSHPDFVNSKGRARPADDQAPAIRSLLESSGWSNPRALGRTPGFKGRYERDVFVADRA